MFWSVQQAGHLYETGWWGLASGALAFVLGLGAIAIALMAPGRPKKRAPERGLVGASAMTLALAILYLALPVIVWVRSEDPFFAASGEVYAHLAFRRLLVLEVGGAFVGTWLASWALGAAHQRRLRPARAKRLRVAGALTMCLGAVGAVHGTLLIHRDCLPRLHLENARWVFAGHPTRIDVLAACAEGYEVTQGRDITPERVGPMSMPLSATSGLLDVSRVAHIRVQEESGSPRFELREGNRWTYHRIVVTQRIAGYFQAERHEERTPVHVEVLAPIERRGLRRFPVVMREPERESRVELVGVAGALYRYDEGELVEYIGVEPLERPIQQFLIPGFCAGIWEGEGPQAPARCAETETVLSSMGSTLLRFLTVGAVTYEPPRESFVLVSAEWGPEDAPGIPSRGELAPIPSPIQAARQAAERREARE